MSNLGDFLTGMVMRSHQGTQDRAALNTLTQFSGDQDEQHTEKLAQRGKQASALRNVIKSYSDNPDLGQAINSLGVDQLEGILHGMALNQAQKEMEAKAAESQAQAAWLNQRTADASEEGNALSQFAGTLAPLLAPGNAPASDDDNNFSIFGGYHAAPGNAPAPASSAPNINGAVLTAMAGMGRTNPKMAGVMLGKILPSIMQNAGEDLTPGTFSDETTGAHFAFRGKQFLPAGYDPKVTGAGKPTPQHDDDGNLIGYTLTDARGHSTFHTAKGSAKLKQATDQSGNVIEGFYMDDSGKLHDTRSAMDKLMGSDEPAKPDYKTADEVREAFKANKIDRDAAKKILADKFGMK